MRHFRRHRGFQAPSIRAGPSSENGTGAGREARIRHADSPVSQASPTCIFETTQSFDGAVPMDGELWDAERPGGPQAVLRYAAGPDGTGPRARERRRSGNGAA